jgi:hypothetical protein
VTTMNVVEKSKYRTEDGTISRMDRVSATLDHGLSWYGRMQAQEIVTQRLGRVLGDQHNLLRNFNVPGIEEGQPFMVLVSPQGVRLLMAYASRGVFRAKEQHWLRFESRTRKFKRTQPNLQTDALNLLKRIQQLLEIQGHENFDTEAVLIFTHPRTLIDSARPITRVVSADAVEYFAANVEQSDVSINPDRVNAIVDALLNPKIPDPELAAELLAEIEEEKTVPTFKVSEPISQEEQMVQDETIERLESFFQSDELVESSIPGDTAAPWVPEFTEQPESAFSPDSEPELDHIPAFYPDSLETFDQDSFEEYPEPASHSPAEEPYSIPSRSYSLADDMSPISDDLYPQVEEPYASPDSFEPMDSYAPKPKEKTTSKRSRISGGQWILLSLLAVIEFGILLYFAYVILTDLEIF